MVRTGSVISVNVNAKSWGSIAGLVFRGAPHVKAVPWDGPQILQSEHSIRYFSVVKCWFNHVSACLVREEKRQKWVTELDRERPPKLHNFISYETKFGHKRHPARFATLQLYFLPSRRPELLYSSCFFSWKILKLISDYKFRKFCNLKFFHYIGILTKNIINIKSVIRPLSVRNYYRIIKKDAPSVMI